MLERHLAGGYKQKCFKQQANARVLLSINQPGSLICSARI
jgi:hypothetical protein